MYKIMEGNVTLPLKDYNDLRDFKEQTLKAKDEEQGVAQEFIKLMFKKLSEEQLNHMLLIMDADVQVIIAGGHIKNIGRGQNHFKFK